MSEYLEETLQEIYKEEFEIKVEYFDIFKYKILVKKNKSKKHMFIYTIMIINLHLITM